MISLRDKNIPGLDFPHIDSSITSCHMYGRILINIKIILPSHNCSHVSSTESLNNYSDYLMEYLWLLPVPMKRGLLYNIPADVRCGLKKSG